VWPFNKKEPDENTWEEMNRMVITFMREQKPDDADAVAEELYKYTRERYGMKHENTATALNNLGFINIMKKDFEKAESYLLMALQVTEEAYGKDAKEVAVVNMNLAKLYIARAKEIQSLEGLYKGQQEEEREVTERLEMRKSN
jgi:hypothetical protein